MRRVKQAHIHALKTLRPEKHVALTLNFYGSGNDDYSTHILLPHDSLK